MLLKFAFELFGVAVTAGDVRSHCYINNLVQRGMIVDQEIELANDLFLVFVIVFAEVGQPYQPLMNVPNRLGIVFYPHPRQLVLINRHRIKVG